MSRPGRPEQNPADVWDALVAQGMAPEQATAEVTKRFGPPPSSGPPQGLFRDSTQYISGIAQPDAPPPPQPSVLGGQNAPAPRPPRALNATQAMARSEGTPSRTLSALYGVNQGQTFGFGDEAGALISALMTGHPIKNYRQNLDYLRERGRMAQEANPGTTLAAEFAGGAMVPLGAAGATGQGLKAAAKAGALTGALGGGLAGAGASEGGIEDRLAGAGRGAAAGAVIGTILPPVARGVGKAGAVAADLTGARGVVDRLATRLGRNPTPIESNPQRADRLLVEALGRDESPVSAVAAELRAAQKPLTVMDVAGENVRGLGRAAQSIPSKAKNQIANTLETRAEEQGARVVGDLEQGLGMGRQDVFQKADELIAQRKQAAAPLYEAAYAKGPVEIPEFTSAMELPQFKAAYKRAQRIAATEGVSLPPADGPVTVQTVDYVKRGLDDLIDSKMRSGGMGRTEARALRQRLDGVLAEVDKAVPEYAKARAQFAGDSRMIDALEQGRDFLKTDARVTRKELAAMSDGEKELYRTGAMDAIRQAMDKTSDTRNVVTSIFGNETKRAQLRALFPDQASFDEFARAMEQEATMASTKHHVLGGSPTQRIAAEQMDMAEGAIQPMMQAMSGNTLGAAMALVGRGLMTRAKGVTEGTANALAPRLTATAGNEESITALLRALQEAEQRAARQTARRQATTRGASIVAGSERAKP